jgi:hypothetical protein
VSADRRHRGRGRAAVLGAIVGVVVIIFAVMLGVSQCAPNDSDSGDEPGHGTAVEQVVGVGLSLGQGVG